VTTILRALLAIVDFALALPGASLRVPSAPIWLWLVYGIALTGLIWAIRTQRLTFFLSSAVAVISLQAAIALANLPDRPPGAPTITFLDVGQGDAIFIQFPDGKKMLIDGGGVTAGRFLGLRDESTFSIGENVVSPFLWSQGIRKLDVVVLTHAHNDHLDGLLDVVENFRVGQLWLGRNSVNSAFRELLRRAMARQIPIRWVATGDAIPVSASGSPFPRFNVLHPPSNWRPKPNDQNDDSVVLLLDTGEVTALLTGDITRKIAVPETVDVYKVAHHGSKGVKLQVHAPIRVISVGANNPFGHPDPSTLPALRTDQLGAITVTLANHPPAVQH
jgi:competence protein ComEC